MAGLSRVGFAGLGIMGGPMARNLREAGYDVAVYTRTAEKAERFAAEHGARSAATPAEAAEGADAFVTMVPDGPEVEQVLLGEQGAVAALADDALVVDMSTTSASSGSAAAAPASPNSTSSTCGASGTIVMKASAPAAASAGVAAARTPCSAAKRSAFSRVRV